MIKIYLEALLFTILFFDTAISNLLTEKLDLERFNQNEIILNSTDSYEATILQGKYKSLKKTPIEKTL